VKLAPDRGVCLAILLIALTACSSYPPLMRSAQRQSVSGEYALVTFLRPAPGVALSGYLLWDGMNYIGELRPGTYVQVKVNAGEHVFVIQDQNFGAVYANVLAGRSYFINVSAGVLPIRPVAAALRPDDSRIDGWFADLRPTELDPLHWQEQQKDCEFPFLRPVSTAACNAVVAETRKELRALMEGKCEPISPPFAPYCEPAELHPADGC
jgi:hypothetical protein